MTAIEDCKDSNLLTDEFYNSIYRNIEELNKNYLDTRNKVKKSELDSSLDILEDILNDDKTTFKSLLEDYQKIKIDNLNDNFLPCSAKQNNLKKAILDKRNTFRYKINEPNNEFDNDGLDPNEYQKILKSITETQKVIFDNGKINSNVIEEEKKLDKSLAGAYLLPYIFNLINFDSDKLKNDDSSYNKDYFAKVKDSDEGKIPDVDGPGILPILTGGGKTTKLVRCLLTCIFLGKYVILITTNEELAADTENHHNTWLQYANGIPYKCVIHRKEEKDKTGKETVNINELKDLHNNHGENFNKVIKDIKEKLIDKENTIIIFDEAHFSNTSYQVVQPLIIRIGYNILLISTSKPRNVYSLTKFHNQTDWENEKTQIFFRTTANEYLRKTTNEEDKNAKPLLKSELTPKQFEMLEKSDIPFVIFDSLNSSAVTGITEGMPPGSLFIANVNHEMGFSLAIDNVILTAFLTTQKLKELTPSNDIVYYIISGIILPKKEKLIKELNSRGYPFATTNEDHEYQNLLWASIALPYKKNHPMEAVIIGMIGKPRGTVSKREICSTYENEPDPN
ncbi:6983_t:CDS:2, partial [Scutellospora calospora]